MDYVLELSSGFAVTEKENATHYVISKKELRVIKRKIKQEIYSKVMLNEDNLNKNLLRIMRERSNADRKLRPKKEHDGVVVVSMLQMDWKYKDDTGRPQTDIIWRSTIQTPFDASIPYDGIEPYVLNGIKSFLVDVGCEYITTPENNGNFQLFKGSDGQLVNGVFKWAFRCNLRSHFWEIDLYSTQCFDLSNTEQLRYLPSKKDEG